MKDIINTSGTFHQSPSFEDCTNLKEFFVRDDALENITTEVVFSIFERYTCKANCSMCYVQDEWLDNETFGKFVPREITPEIEAKILAFFEYFEIVTTMDDLYYIKNNYPQLYDFYLKHSHLMSSTAMTDMAFIQQFDIIMNDMNFQMIYEISFNDQFLNKKNGQFVHTIIEKLEVMNEKCPIKKIKIILCNKDEDDLAVKAMIDWAHSKGMYVELYDNFYNGTNDRFEVTNADHQETNHYTIENYLYLIRCEVIYLQFTSLFLTISQAISCNSVPFYDLATTTDMPLFIKEMLKAKVREYGDESKTIGDACNNKYYDYFKFVSNSVKVNEDYNFIPRFVLKPYSQLYQRLVEEGYTNTPAGLIKTGATVPIPLFTIKEDT